MILMLDAMADRYSLLPSEILRNGDTLDLFIFDAAMSYRRYKEQAGSGKAPVQNIPQEILQKEMENFKNERKSRR